MNFLARMKIKNYYIIFLFFGLFFFAAGQDAVSLEQPQETEETEIAAIEAEVHEEIEPPLETTEKEGQAPTEEFVPSEETTESEDPVISPDIALETIQSQRSINVPIFGKIIFEQSRDSETGTPTLTGRPAQANFNLGVIQIKDPIFQYNTADGLRLTSNISLNAPPLGAISTKLSAQFTPDFKEFTGSIDEPISFKDNIVLQNVQMVVNTAGSVQLSGELKLLFMAGDVKIIDTTIFAKISISKIAGKTKVEFLGKLQTPEPLRPFALIPGISQVKEIRDISISNISVGLDSTGDFFFTGSSTVLGLTTTAKAIKTRNGLTLKASPEGAFDVSKIIPGLKGSPMEKLDFSNMTLAISSASYEDPDTKLTLPPGISFIIQSKLDAGPLAGIAKLVGSQSLNIVGTFGTSLDDLALSVAVPSIIQIPDPTNPQKTIASLESLVLSIKGKGPSISGKVRIKTRLPMSKQDAVFAGELGMELSEPISINVKGSMVGIWNDVLGIRGLALGDLGFELGLGYSQALATTLSSAISATGAITFGVGTAVGQTAGRLLGFYPSRIAYTGYLGIGSRSVRMATKLTDNLDVVLLGEFKGSLSTTDLTEFAAKLGAKIPLDKLIDLEVKDSIFKVAFGETSIGDIKFSPGVAIKGQLIVKGAGGIAFPAQSALVDITVSANGISAAGSLPKLKIGNFLEITGAGPDQKYGTPDDGPAFKIALTTTEQMLYISGDTFFLGNRSKIEVNVSPQKAYFYSLQKMHGMFEIEWKGESVGAGPTLDFKVEGNLTNEVHFGFSKEDLIRSIETLEKERVKAVVKRDNELAGIDKKIIARDAELKKTNHVYRTVVQGFEKGTRQIEAKEKAVHNMNLEIEKLQKSLGLVFNDTMDLWNSYFEQPYLLASNTTQPPAPLARPQPKKDLFLETGESIKGQFKKGAQQFQKGSGKFFSILFNPTKWVPTARLNGLITARNIAVIALGAHKFANERIKESLQMLDPKIGYLFRMRSAVWFKHLPELAKWEAAKGFVQGAINSYPAIKWLTPVAVKKLKLNANLRKLLPPKLGLPDIECTLNAFGIENTIVVKNANINDLPNLIKDLAITFVKEFQEHILGVKTPVQPPDLPVLEQLKQGTLIAIKSLAWNKYLRVENGKYLKATGIDKNDPLCQFSIVRQGNWLGFKSFMVKNFNLQAVPAKNRGEYQVRFENANLGLWELWILNPEKPESLDVVCLQNQLGGWLSVYDPALKNWSLGRVWTAAQDIKGKKIPSTPGNLERLAIEIIPVQEQLQTKK